MPLRTVQIRYAHHIASFLKYCYYQIMAKQKKNTNPMLSMNVMIIAFVAFVIGFGLGAKLMQTQTKAPEKMTEPSPTPIAMYTLEEIAMHDSKDDCWQAIDGMVYDFTSYLASDEHPGGGAMIKDCGTDASEAYANKPPHSEYARSLLPDYEIGKLK